MLRKRQPLRVVAVCLHPGCVVCWCSVGTPFFASVRCFLVSSALELLCILRLNDAAWTHYAWVQIFGAGECQQGALELQYITQTT